MNSGGDPLLDLIAVVQEAVLDPRLWSNVVTMMAGLFLNARVSFGVVHRRLGVPALSAETPSRFDQRLFYERYMTPETNPGLQFVAATRPLAIEDRQRLVSDRDLVKLDFYNDIMRPADMWHAVTLNMHRDERYLAPLGILRSRAQGPFTGAEMRLLTRLAPHLNRAIRSAVRLKEIEAQADATGEMIDRINVGVVLTDAFGRVAHVNRLAGSILDDADGLVIRHGVLRATSREHGFRLARLILEAAGGEKATQLLRPSGVIQVPRPSLRRPLPLVVTPTRNAASLFGQSSAVSIMFADPERAPEADAEMLGRLYGLTRREATVAVLLLHGRSPADVAGDLAMTMNTVRTHIQHIFQKTEVDRLSELVRLLLLGPLGGRY